MTISLKHNKTSSKSDGTDSSLVQPSDWNAEHTLTLAAGTVLGRFAGTNGAAQELPITVTSAGSVTLTNTTDITPGATWSGHLTIGANGYSGGFSFDATGMWVGHNSSGRALIFATDETERMRVSGAGNVGIGTSSPGAKLSVQGVANAHDGSSAGGSFALGTSVNGVLSATSSSLLTINGAGYSNVSINGNVGIGTSSPGYKLDVSGGINSSNLRAVNSLSPGLTLVNTTTSATYNIYNAHTATNGFNGLGIFDGTAYQFSIVGGNTGIGTTTPGAKLDVAGVIRNSSNIESSGSSYLYSYNGGTSGQVRSGVYLDGANNVLTMLTGTNERLRITSGGDVAIGGTSASYKLHVYGTVYGTGTSYGVYGYSTGNFGVYGQSTTSAGVYAVASAGTGNGLLASAAGNYGVCGYTSNTLYGGVIGYAQNWTTYGILGYNNQWSLYGNASTYISGTYQTSDERLKDNIVDVGDSLARLKQLEIKSFDWKPNSDPANAGRTHEAGVIAQQAIHVFPEIIRENTAPPVMDGQTATLNQQLGTFLTADYGMLIPHLVRAVQQQADTIEALQARIAALEGAV